MMRKSILVLAVVAALTVGIFAATSSAQKSTTVTVGDFAVKVAKALGNKAASPREAAALLQKAGVNLEKNLSAELTEGQAAGILRDLGIKALTSNPDKSLSAAKADQLAVAVSLSSASSVGTDDFNPPSSCQETGNRGTCVDCCKAAVGPIFNRQGNPQDPGKLCTIFCSTVVPPGLSSDPEPIP